MVAAGQVCELQERSDRAGDPGHHIEEISASLRRDCLTRSSEPFVRQLMVVGEIAHTSCRVRDSDEAAVEADG
jgi:hypothetical protein